MVASVAAQVVIPVAEDLAASVVGVVEAAEPPEAGRGLETGGCNG